MRFKIIYTATKVKLALPNFVMYALDFTIVMPMQALVKPLPNPNKNIYSD